MDCYQIVEFVFRKHSYYCIWFSIESEGFVTSENNLMIFSNIIDAKNYAESKSISLLDDICIYDVDQINKWAINDRRTVDCNMIINFWNIIQDITTSTNRAFLGNVRNQEIDDVYDQLFYGLNIIVEKGEGLFYPRWSKSRIILIRKIVLDGVHLCKSIFIN